MKSSGSVSNEFGYFVQVKAPSEAFVGTGIDFIQGYSLTALADALTRRTVGINLHMRKPPLDN